MSIFLGKVLVFAFAIAGILALVIVPVNIDLQQVNRSLYRRATLSGSSFFYY